jgi:cytoskeleton protein RodZ
MSLADVATKLKLTVRQVEALEAEDTAHLPGDIFLRGFVRNYARLMDLDPDELIAPMDAQATVSETITAHSEGVTLGSSGLKRWVFIPLVLLGVFVVFVAVLYQWLRQGEDALVPQTEGDSTQAIVTESLSLQAVEPAPATLPAPAGQAGPDVSPDMAPEGNGQPEEKAPPQAPPVPVSADVSASPSANEPPAVTPPKVPASASNTHVLRFQTDQDAWIQVVDGEGRRFSKLIRAGSADSISGVAPFKLVVGEASQVRLTYDGHPIDLTPFIGQKVARLTLE